MADQVTISTFLELRDNMTQGLQRIADALQVLAGKAPSAQAALNKIAKDAEATSRRIRQTKTDEERAAAKAAKEQEKIAARHARYMRLAAEKSAKDRIRIEQQVTAAFEQAEARRVAAAKKAADSAQKPQEKLRKDQLFGTMLKAKTAERFIFDAIPSAIGGLVSHFKKVASEGQEFEDAVNRISLSLTGLNVAPSMRAAKRETEGIYTIMREMAAKLPGETQDYIRVYSQGLPDALTAGMTDLKKYAEFVSKFTAIAISRNVGSIRAATDLEQILEGRARVTTRTYAELRPYIGMLARDFNQLAPVERMERLQKAVNQASHGIGDVATSANAIFGEAVSHMKEIYTIGEKPLFDSIKATISDINVLFVKNRDVILATAEVVSTTLGDAFRGLVPIVTNIATKISEFVSSIDSSSVLYKLANFASFQLLDVGATARRIGAATREAEKTQKSLDIYKKYKNVLPAVSDLSGKALDTQLKYLWRASSAFLKEGRGVEVFKSQEDWDAFVTAITGKQDKAMELWKQMVSEGIVQTFKMPHAGEAERRGRLKRAPTDRAQNVYDFRNSRFDIKQEFAEGFDPDRIAVAFSESLGRLGEMKLQAAYAQVGSVR